MQKRNLNKIWKALAQFQITKIWLVKLYLVSGIFLSQSLQSYIQYFAAKYFGDTSSKFTEIFCQYSYYQNRTATVIKSVLNLFSYINIYWYGTVWFTLLTVTKLSRTVPFWCLLELDFTCNRLKITYTFVYLP